jgi:MoxR-like ATPase
MTDHISETSDQKKRAADYSDKLHHKAQSSQSELSTEEAQKVTEQFRSVFNILKTEIQKFIVGQDDVIDNVLNAIICGGHVLLEGVPGLGKTALVHTIAKALHLSFKRIQFTPDLLPSDIVGSNILIQRENQKAFQFEPGPVFCNILLADEINRATPKTQSALLETMQEKSVTVSGTTHALTMPFFVLATQNPIEYIGTYPLPEAQLDRFFMRITLGYPSVREEMDILKRFTEGDPKISLKESISINDIISAQTEVENIECSSKIYEYVASISMRTRNEEYVRLGISPRGSLSLLMAAKAKPI